MPYCNLWHQYKLKNFRKIMTRFILIYPGAATEAKKNTISMLHEESQTCIYLFHCIFCWSIAQVKFQCIMMYFSYGTFCIEILMDWVSNFGCFVAMFQIFCIECDEILSQCHSFWYLFEIAYGSAWNVKFEKVVNLYM